jgi:hypothetical protein
MKNGKTANTTAIATVALRETEAADRRVREY